MLKTKYIKSIKKIQHIKKKQKKIRQRSMVDRKKLVKWRGCNVFMYCQ